MSSLTRINIFICHSSADEQLVQDFRIHLDPLMDLTELRVWEDSMLFAGKPWDPAIRNEIENSVAAIILVSPKLLQSKYVRERELPRFLALALTYDLHLFCLYLDYSVVDQLAFQIDIDNDIRSVKLTDYQGLNSPSKPLIAQPKKQLSRLLSEAAKVVFERLNSSDVTARKLKVLRGVVDRTPSKGRKTIYVNIERLVEHKRYKKKIKQTKTLSVHWEEDIVLSEGDLVEIKECRPMSKTKHHVLIRKLSH